MEVEGWLERGKGGSEGSGWVAVQVSAVSLRGKPQWHGGTNTGWQDKEAIN